MDRISTAVAVFGLLCFATSVSTQSISTGGAGCGASLKPNVPGLVAKALTTTSIEVAWNKPSNGACVTSYEVLVVPASTAKGATSPKPVTTKDYKVTVTGLTPDTEYTVTVTAKGSGGSASATTKVKTLKPVDPCAVLPPKPTGVKALPLSTSAIRVSWNKAPADACVTGFYVEVIPPKQAKSTATKSFKYPTSRVSVDISGLERNTVYTVRVYSENGKGRSAPTEVKVKTL